MNFQQDLRYGWRAIAQMPGLTAVIVLSIALGIAANTTVFSVANGLLWGLLPVKEPARMVMFSEGESFSYPDYLDYQDQTADIFDGGVAAHFPIIPASVGGSGTPERVWGQSVSGNYFSILGLRMELGRPILPHDDAVLGRDAVAVLSHGLWKRRFAADPRILNREVTLNGKPYLVVGVTPPGFEGADRGIVPEFWVPLSMTETIAPILVTDSKGRNSRDDRWLMLDARLKPGVSRASAVAKVNLVKKRLDDKYRPAEKNHQAVTLQPAGGLIAGSATPVYLLMTVLMVLAGALLLLVCANVGNLLLAKASGRQKEIAVRMALGSTRRRLITQLLTESTLLALMGAALGLLLAGGAARILSSFQLPIPLPIKFDFNLDFRVLAFTVVLTPLTALAFGLIPALRSTRLDLAAVLKTVPGDSPSGKRFTLRNTLVVAQVAISAALLVAAGLFLRSARNAALIDVGFKPDGILIAAIDPGTQGYSDEKTKQFLLQVREKVAAIPGVKSVSFTDIVPLSLAGSNYDFTTETSGSAPVQKTNANVVTVTDRFFETMGMPIRQGRDFHPQGEVNGAIINEHMAAQLFPRQDPIGKTINNGKLNYTIVGLTQNSKTRFIGDAPDNTVYMQVGSSPSPASSFFGISMLVKGVGEPGRFERPVRSAIAALDPNMAVFNVETMESHVSKSLLLPRITSLVMGLFGAIGLSLAAIGLFAVMSYWVRRRVHEIGIRMALGARPGALLKMVLGQGLAMTAVGLVIGIGLALLLGRSIASLLYGVAGTDLRTYAAVSAVLILTAIVATIVPALRAARVEPSTALRHE